MAIFAERFFTADYRGLPGVFLDRHHAHSDVAEFLQSANREAEFPAIAKAPIRAGGENLQSQNLSGQHQFVLQKIFSRMGGGQRSVTCPHKLPTGVTRRKATIIYIL